MSCRTVLFATLALATHTGAALSQAGYYDERGATSSGAHDHRSSAPHANPTTRLTSSRTGDGGGTAEQITFASDPAPYVFGRAEAWNAGGAVSGSSFSATLSYGFSVSGPANGLVPVRFRGRYAINNDNFLTATFASFFMSAHGMDFSRPDQIGMEAGCSGGGYDGGHCYHSAAGWPSTHGVIDVTQRVLGFDAVLWGTYVAGTFEGLLMAPTDASGWAQGTVGLAVSGGAVGVRDNGVSGISWAFIDPELTVDTDYLTAHPEARLVLTQGVGNELAPLPVPEPGTWLLMLGGLAGLLWRAGRHKLT